MPNWKKLIVSGSDASLNSLNVATSFTASGLTYPSSDNGEFSFIQTDGNGNLSLQYVNTIYEVIHNGETTQIAKGTPLYVSGSQGANSIVYRADAGNPAKMPVTYIAADNIDPGTTGRGIVLGLITGVNTTGYPPGTEIYVAVGGGWTSTRPTGSAIVQLLGIVTKEGNGGQGLVLNPGPFNKPNLNPGDVWVGDNNWIGQPIPTSSLSVNFALTSSYTTGPIATATVPGIVELFSNTVQATAANAVTTTASRTYGIQLNSSGQMVVNVPWTDTVYTHPSYTARSITATGAQVLSTFTSDTLGHVTGITTRSLTAADIGAASTSHNHTLDSLSNVTITSNTNGEILRWNGTAWINNTLAEAGIQAALTNPVTGIGVSGQVAFWNGTNTITGNTNLTYSSGILTLTGTNGSVVLGATGDQLSFTRNGPVYISANGGASSQLYFEVNGAERWRMLATGVWQSNGAQTIQSSTGNLTIATAAGNGNIILSPNGTGFLDSQLRSLLRGNVTIGSTTLTDRARLHIRSETTTTPTLGNGGTGISLITSNSDVNYGTVFFTKGNGQGSIQQMRVDGTATSYSLTLQELGGNVLIGTTTDGGQRLQVSGNTLVTGTLEVDTVNNGVGDFVTLTAGGILTKRTAAEVRTDIGAQAALTNPVTGTGVANQITYWSGTNTVTGSNNFVVDNSNIRIGLGTNVPSTTLDIITSGASISRIRGGSADNQGAGYFVTQGNSNTTLLAIGDGSTMVGGAVNNPMLFFNVGPLSFSAAGTTRAQLLQNGNFLLGTTTDSGDRLRVNGTVRLDSVTNATGDFVRIDANNVLRRRTAAETLSDIGAQAELDIISLAELTTGTATTERSVNAKNLNDWLSGVLSGSNGYNEESLTYTTSNVFTLSQSNPTAINVYIHGQRKRPGLDYTVLGNQITFLDTLQPSFDIKVTYFYSIPGVALSGTGTANYITKWNGTTGLANSILYDTGTNAGISETNPQARLDINGTLRVQSIPNGIGDFITTDVSGSIRRRTAAETLVDIGAVAPIHKHTQGTASTSWVITHNLNFTNPLVTIYNNENKVIIPKEIISTSNNVVTILLTEATSGYATIAGGSLAVISETQAIVNSLIFG